MTALLVGYVGDCAASETALCVGHGDDGSDHGGPIRGGGGRGGGRVHTPDGGGWRGEAVVDVSRQPATFRVQTSADITRKKSIVC